MALVKIEIIERCRVAGDRVLPGEVKEVQDVVAKSLIGMRRAIPFVEPVVPVETGDDPAGEGKPTRKPKKTKEDSGGEN